MINKKAQSLTELAVFGSILLLVLSFLISYGMRYNYQQDLQMRSFRRALSEAYVSGRPDATASVVMLEDKHIPDPRDMFGAGSIVPVQAGAEVTWGNTLNDMPNVSVDPLAPDLPRVEYRINGATYQYTTARYTPAPFENYYFKVPGQAERVKISKTDIKIYNPDPVEDPLRPGAFLPATQVMIDLTPAEIDPLKKQKDTFSEVAISEKGPLMKIVKVLPEDGKDGDAITSFWLLNPAGAQIDLRYAQLNNDIDNDGTPDVTSANIQGLLLDSEQKIRRSGELTITATPGKIPSSTSTYSFKDKAGNPTTITHKIRENLKAVPTDIPYDFPRGKTSTWTTP